MLKHVSTTTMTRRRRAASPAPSSTSISTLESSGSSASSTCSSPSASSNSSSSSSCHLSSESSGHNSSSTSWRGLADCRTFSRFSVTENPNAMPLRVYAATLRPDIQYKTIGVTSTTTCEDVIGALLTKCKVRFKDPRLFQLVMEVEIRCPDGCNTRASIKLEDRAIPLQLQECYPRGQARFILELRQGALVKIFDESHTVGWQYKSILISEKTTAGELVDILFRFTTKNLDDVHFYMLHLQVKDWRRPLGWNELVLSAKEAATRAASPEEVKIILKAQMSPAAFASPPSHYMRTSTLSLYDNVTMPPHTNFVISPSSSSNSSSSVVKSLETNTLGRFHARLRKQRSKSFSESPSSSPDSSVSSDSFRVIQGSPFKINHPSLTESVLASLTKFGTNSRYGKYDLTVSEAFFV